LYKTEMHADADAWPATAAGRISGSSSSKAGRPDNWTQGQ
jgi:hypothetical protein